MKQVIISIVAAGVLLKVLFNTNDYWTKIIVFPFLVFAVGLGIKNALIIMGKKILAVKISKIYVGAFLIYLFAFLVYWDYLSFVDGKYMQILFSIPFWLGGLYFTYKRVLKKDSNKL